MQLVPMRKDPGGASIRNVTLAHCGTPESTPVSGCEASEAGEPESSTPASRAPVALPVELELAETAEVDAAAEVEVDAAAEDGGVDDAELE